MNVTIKPSDPDDILKLASILSEWIDTTPWMPRLHTRADDIVFVTSLVTAGGTRTAWLDGTPVGFLALAEEEVRALYVSARSRGRGVGTSLLDAAKASRDRLMLWTFAANTGARRFYTREGFREAGGTDGHNEEMLPDIRMIWEREAEG